MQGDSLHVFILSVLEQLISADDMNDPGQEEGNQEEHDGDEDEGHWSVCVRIEAVYFHQPANPDHVQNVNTECTLVDFSNP